MKKRAASAAVCTMLCVSLLSGCSNITVDTTGVYTSSSDPSSPSVSNTETIMPTETTAPDPAEEALKAYNDFIQGKMKVSTEGVFAKDSGKSFLGLEHGSYNIDEMKKAVKYDASTGSQARYVILDFGSDGICELALSLEKLDKSEASVVCIIAYENGTLVMNGIVEESSPDEYKLYETGYFKSDSMPARGIYKMNLIKVMTGGKCKDVFTFSEYLGVSVTEIIKHLSKGEGTSIAEYETLPGDFLVREYISDGDVTFSVGRWATTEGEKSLEEKFVAAIKAMGAEEVTEERMAQLSATKVFTTKEVNWTDCTGESSSPSSAGVADVAGRFGITIYPNPDKPEYSQLGNVVYVLCSGNGTDMRFVADSDDVTVILEKGSWDMNTDTFAPEKEVFNVQTKAGTVYQFNCVVGDVFPYYRLRAKKGNFSAEWLVLKSNDDSATVIKSSMTGDS